MPTNSILERGDASALIPEDAAREIIQATTEASALLSVSRRLPNMSRKQQRLPVVNTQPTAYFVTGDNGLKNTTDMTWDNVYLNAEELAVIVPMPQALLDDADYNIAQEMRPHLVEAFGQAIDQAMLFGTNKPSAWPTAIRAAAISAGNNVALGTGTDVYDDLLGAAGVWSKVEADGYMVNGTIAATSFMGRLRGLRDGVGGQPIFLQGGLQGTPNYTLLGQPVFFPRNGGFATAATHAFSGDWSQIVYSIRQDITYSIADQGVITDNAGNIVYNLFQQDMVALRAVMRVAVAVPNPINRLQGTAANRYPIGVLTT
jgi:HK97 family phage major capsid protein